jgi:predicted PurR-regulated permease PerM
MSDKRAQFFALTALVCFALVPLAQDAYREITLAVAATYVLLAAASWLDHRGRR